ncbi:MAG: helix-turn-helix domain-containing protein, partial [Patescibacteria group bacterium]
VSTNDIIGKSRKQEIVEPRQIAIYLMRDMLNLSYPYIAEKLGKRDHTTAIYSYEKINKKLQEDQELNQKLLSIKDILEDYC